MASRAPGQPRLLMGCKEARAYGIVPHLSAGRDPVPILEQGRKFLTVNLSVCLRKSLFYCVEE